MMRWRWVSRVRLDSPFADGLPPFSMPSNPNGTASDCDRYPLDHSTAHATRNLLVQG